MAAWADALLRTQRTARLREKYPAKSLKRALEFYAVAPGSTSGIEQNFSQLKRAMNEHWCGSPAAEERRMVLLVGGGGGKAQAKDSPTVRAAQVVWATTFGAPRLSGESRTRGLGFRLPRKRALREVSQTKSHAAWLRKRRAMARDAQLLGSDAPPAALEAVGAHANDQWTERHTKEVERQKDVRTKRHLDAVVCGTAAAGSLGPEADVAAHYRNEKKLQVKTAQEAARIQKIRAPSAVPLVQGRTTWVDPAVEADVRGESTQRVLAEQRVVDNRTLAEVIVVKDPSNPGTRNHTVAALRGSALVDPTFLVSPARGVALTFRSMLALRRTVFFSTGVCKAHAGMVDIVRGVAQAVPQGRQNRWQLFVGDKQYNTFLEEAGKSIARKRRCEVATVLLKAELYKPDFAASARRTTMPDFVDALAQLDTGKSRTGVGRR